MCVLAPRILSVPIRTGVSTVILRARSRNPATHLWIHPSLQSSCLLYIPFWWSTSSITVASHLNRVFILNACKYIKQYFSWSARHCFWGISQRLRDSQTHRLRDSQAQRFTGSQGHSPRDSQAQRLTDSQGHSPRDSQAQWLTILETHRLRGSKAQRLTGSESQRIRDSQGQRLRDRKRNDLFNNKHNVNLADAFIRSDLD